VRAAKDIVVFRSGPLRSAPLQNPKDFGFGQCYEYFLDVAAASRGFSQPHRFRYAWSGLVVALFGSWQETTYATIPLGKNTTTIF
jgi:hypothetical protein